MDLIFEKNINKNIVWFTKKKPDINTNTNTNLNTNTNMITEKKIYVYVYGYKIYQSIQIPTYMFHNTHFLVRKTNTKLYDLIFFC